MSKKIKYLFNEEWKIVEDRAQCRTHWVSNYGRMKSVDKETGDEALLKGSIEKRGFRVVNIRLKNKKNRSIFIHREVAENFVEQLDEGKKYIHHKDGDKQNNYWRNIEWIGEQEWKAKNAKSLVKREIRGQKLNESQVKMIKKMLLRGKNKRKTIARQFGVSETQIKRIEREENWAHVKAYEHKEFNVS